MNRFLQVNTVTKGIVPMDSPGMPTTLRAGRLDREAGLFLRLVAPFTGKPISHEQVGRSRRAWRLAAVTLNPSSSAGSKGRAARSCYASTRRKGRRG